MLTYKGNDLSNLIIVNNIGRPILPPQILSTKEIYGRPGAFFFEKRHGPIVLPVEVTLNEKDHTNYRALVRQLAVYLDSDEPGPMIFSDEPDKFINGILMDESALDEIATMGRGELQFYCPDPYWYAVNDDVMSWSNPGTYTLDRQGTANSNPLIEIQGTNSSGSIELTTDNTTIKFTGTLLSGETLVLDSEYITAYIVKTDGTQVSAIHDIDNINFPVLVPGANQLTISVNGGATVTQFKVTARSRWK
ncbi:distal tail protein Dit [Aeribacillus pallidus]|uniref:distal tail protein Dit n=1 Tax=Aeribacillus pallidus TaxID=33936 RepID=UPI003D1AD3E9